MYFLKKHCFFPLNNKVNFLNNRVYYLNNIVYYSVAEPNLFIFGPGSIFSIISAPAPAPAPAIYSTCTVLPLKTVNIYLKDN